MPAQFNQTPYLHSRCPNCKRPGSIRNSRVRYGNTEHFTTLRICTRCGWEKIDVPRVPFQAVCSGADCGENLGSWNRWANEEAPVSYCEDCSKERVANGQHDTAGARVVFKIPCAACGTQLHHVAYPEGHHVELPEKDKNSYFCGEDTECARNRPREMADSA